jgi:hypothetical protein
MKSFYPLLVVGGLAGTLMACGGNDNNRNHSSSSSSSVASSPVSSSSSSSSSVAVVSPDAISLSFIGRYNTNVFGKSAAEIPAFDPASKRAFVVNAQAGELDVLDLTNPETPVKISSINAQSIAAGAVVNSVAVHNGIVAIAVEAAVKTDNGFVALYKASDLGYLSHVAVGALPDMLTFTPDSKTLLVANEGEPGDDYGIDPEGSISVIDVTNVTAPVVRTANFHAFNGKEAELRAKGVRIFGPGASAAEDFEPEYIAVSADSKTAWAALQENNAFAKIDITTATVTDIYPMGYKDHGLAGQGLDPTDTDKKAEVKPWPGVRGLYMPDAIAAYEADGKTWLVSANEGDARAWGEDNDAYWNGDATQGFVEEFRVKHLVHKSGFDRRAGDDLPPQLRELAAGALLNPEVFNYCGAIAGDAKECREDDFLGRLNITWTLGYRTDANHQPVMFNDKGLADPAGDRLMYDALYSYGARSFAIWSEDGELVWDSGDQFEQFLTSADCKLKAARDLPCAEFFNSNHEEGSSFDNRSDNKGPEPEGVVLGKLGEKTFAFIGLERMGGVMVYDITHPQAPVFQDYLNTRENWTAENPGDNLAGAGDLGPEGLAFVAAADSPNGKPLLIVGNEVSGTTSIYEIELQ